MKKSRFQLTLIGIVFLSLTTKAQISASLNGYLSNMQSVMFKKVDESWMIDHLFHNRLNLKVYAGNVLSLNVELRNRLMYGETVKYLPGYADLLDTDRGWKDLTWNLLSESSFILNSSIDRAFIDFHRGGFQATLGRQRINWGMNYIWNPNDVFNSYSFFDFDYVERPGSDGIRLQYYFGSAGHFEIAGKLNQNDDYSIAGLLRFTIAGYDYQLLGGILNEDEYVIGGGFSGYLGPVSFTGEFTFLDPLQEGDPRKNAFIAGAGAGYNTPFNLFLQFEYLYNGAANIEGLTNFNDFSYRELLENPRPEFEKRKRQNLVSCLLPFPASPTGPMPLPCGIGP